MALDPTGNFFGQGGQFSGGVLGSGSAQVGPSQVISPLAIPELAKLFQLAQAQIPRVEDMASIQSMIQGGMASPLLDAVLQPALQRLQAPQEQQRTQLTEAARAAGGLRGSQYGNQFNQLLNQQGLQVNDLMGQVVSQVLGQLLQGQLQEQRNQFLPGASLTDLLKAAAPSVSKGGASASSGWERIPPSQGLQTPMLSDRMTATNTQPAYGLGSATVGPNAGAGSFGGSMAMGGGQAYTPYLGDIMGGGNSIMQNPYSGVYETVTPTPSNPYQHTYGEWMPTDQYEDSFF